MKKNINLHFENKINKCTHSGGEDHFVAVAEDGGLCLWQTGQANRHCAGPVTVPKNPMKINEKLTAAGYSQTVVKAMAVGRCTLVAVKRNFYGPHLF